MEKAYSMHEISNAYMHLFGRTCRKETNFNTKAQVAASIEKQNVNLQLLTIRHVSTD